MKWRRLIVALSLGSFMLAACATVSQEEVDEIGRLVGVRDSSAWCIKGMCSVEVETEPTITAEQLTAVIKAERETEASSYVASNGTDAPSLELDIDKKANPQFDAAAAAAYVRARDYPGVTSWEITAIQGEFRAKVGAPPGPLYDWATGEQLWSDVASLPGASLSITSESEDGTGPSRVVATGEYPKEALATARTLVEGFLPLRVQGVRISNERVQIAVSSVDAARRLEALAGATSTPDGVEVMVVVGQNVLELRDDPQTRTSDAARRAVLTQLDQAPWILTVVRGEKIVLHLERTDLAPLVPVLAAARAAEPQAWAATDLAVRVDDLVDVTLTGPGEEQLVELVAQLSTIDGVTQLSGESDATSWIEVTANRADLQATFSEVARTFSRWSGPPSQIHVRVTVEDPEGRSQDVSLQVERVDNRWVPSSPDRGEKQPDLVAVEAWEAAQ